MACMTRRLATRQTRSASAKASSSSGIATSKTTATNSRSSKTTPIGSSKATKRIPTVRKAVKASAKTAVTSGKKKASAGTVTSATKAKLGSRAGTKKNAKSSKSREKAVEEYWGEIVDEIPRTTTIEVRLYNVRIVNKKPPPELASNSKLEVSDKKDIGTQAEQSQEMLVQEPGRTVSAVSPPDMDEESGGEPEAQPAAEQPEAVRLGSEAGADCDAVPISRLDNVVELQSAGLDLELHPLEDPKGLAELNDY